MLKRNEFTLEVCTSPVENVKSLRETLTDRGWQISSHQGTRLVDRFAIIMPIAQSARTLGLEILDGPLRGLEMHTWAETRGSAGSINIAAWTIPGGKENEDAMAIIREWALSLPRCPWKWTFGERSKIGYFLPVFRRSRKAFRSIGLQDWPKQ
ncbi:MAG: hypothetical protein QGI21_01975 [Candidatus Poseidoniaceae archaeon]|jgi:hypothetical protein|nr:hypothetical protein [Candidatus Poseidoniaceae archaeon]